MTSWSRAVYGALLGAVVTLFVHPVSRPFVAGPFVESSQLIEQQRFTLPTAFPDVLPHPTDEISASLWIHVGAEEIRNRSGLTPRQVEGLIKIANLRREGDRQNAFWPLAAAVFSDHLDKQEEVLKFWQQASQCLVYNDFQSRNLTQLREEIGNFYATNSWQYAYCYRLRSVALGYLIEGLARKLVSRTSRTDLPDLRLRFATLVNGGLLRDGSRFLEIMERGLAIVEIASHPKELQKEPSIKRLLIAHSEFKEAFRLYGMEEHALRVERAYNENDGWSALTKREDTDEKVANLTLFSALWPSLPGVFLQCALVGGILFLFGVGLERLHRSSKRAAEIVTAVAAITISLSVFLLTQSWLALLACALCSVFVMLTPRNPRLHLPRDLGPLFGFMISVMTLVFITVLGAMFLTRTLPVQASADAFDAHFTSIVDSRMTAGLALIILSCLFLFAPLWALAQHIRTLFVLGRGFRNLGIVTCTLSALLAVGVTPVSIHFEAENQETFRMLMENEPVYYVRQ